jgi:hypothetical protein
MSNQRTHRSNSCASPRSEGSGWRMMRARLRNSSKREPEGVRGRPTAPSGALGVLRRNQSSWWRRSMKEMTCLTRQIGRWWCIRRQASGGGGSRGFDHSWTRPGSDQEGCDSAPRPAPPGRRPNPQVVRPRTSVECPVRSTSLPCPRAHRPGQWALQTGKKNQWEVVHPGVEQRRRQRWW